MGRLVTTNTSTSAVAAQAKIDALTSMAMQLRVSVASLRALPTSTFSTLVTMSSKVFTPRFYRDPDGAAFSQLYLLYSGGAPGGTSFDMNSLPGSGDVVLYYDYVSGGNINMAVGTPGGGVVAGIDSTHLSALLPLGTGTGAGIINAITNGDYDSIAIFNGRRTGNARFALPSLSDPDLVAWFPMKEDSGSTFADEVAGGVAGTVGDATLVPGGTWNGAVAPTGPSAAVLHFLREQNRLAGFHP